MSHTIDGKDHHPDIEKAKCEYHILESCGNCIHYWSTPIPYVDGWCSMHADVNGYMAAVAANGKCMDYVKEEKENDQETHS